jgi:hypothetical protein
MFHKAILSGLIVAAFASPARAEDEAELAKQSLNRIRNSTRPSALSTTSPIWYTPGR